MDVWRIIAFGGRIIGEGEPKYLNSPETALYTKGREGLSRRELFDSSPALLAELTPAPSFAL